MTFESAATNLPFLVNASGLISAILKTRTNPKELLQGIEEEYTRITTLQ